MNIKIIVISLLVNFFTWAAPVNIETAQRVAENIYIERSNTNSIAGLDIETIDVLGNGDQELIYVFQLKDLSHQNNHDAP